MGKIKNNGYSASFTAGSLLLDETSRVMKYILNDELELKRQEIIQNNIIKINSESARKRVLQEISKRYKSVDKSVWAKYENSTLGEKKIILFYVAVKTYLLLNDLMDDVIIPKWRRLKRDFGAVDVEVFLNKKSAEHPEIEEWAETTRAKVIQVIQKIMKEAGILLNNRLTALESADHFWLFFVKLGDAWFLDFALLNKEQRERILGNV